MPSDMARNRLRGAPEVLVGVALAQLGGRVDRQADGDVAVERIVGRGLVGDEDRSARRGARAPGTTSAAFPSRPTESARPSLAAACTRANGVVERGRRPRRGSGVVEPALDSARIDLDAQDRRAGHRRREGLGAAHPAEPGGENRPPAQVRTSRSASRPRPRTSGTCPGGFPGCRCRSSSRRSSGRTSSALAPRGAGTRPRSPSGAPAASSRSAPAARRGCVRKTPTGFPLWTSSVSSSPSSSSERTMRLERVVASGGLAGAAVDDELLGLLGDLGVEVVEEHPQRSLGLPRARVQRRPARARESSVRSPQSSSTRASSRRHRSLERSDSRLDRSDELAAPDQRRRVPRCRRRAGDPRAPSARACARSREPARAPAPGSSGARNSMPCAPGEQLDRECRLDVRRAPAGT